jgi:acetoin utilization protein AcuB
MLPSQMPVSRYMSAAPVAVQQRASLADAIALMQKHDVRHLPVLEASALVGIVSERDLAMAGALVPEAWEELRVAEAMTPEPYSVHPDTPITEVAAEMSEHRYGAAVIVGASHELLGLFTTSDALRVLATCDVESRA